MKRSDWIVFLLVFAPVVKLAGAAAGEEIGISVPQVTVKTTLCELGAAPERFQGNVVEIRAVVQTGFQTSLLRDDSCSAFIWLSGVDDPASALRKDRQYQKMLDYLDKKYKPKGGAVCARCPLYKVTATVVGRFEHVRTGDPDPQSDLPAGFGYLHSYESQLTLLSVSNVVAEPIDRSASERSR